MKNKTIRCALWLKSQNISLGDVVVLSSNNRLDSYIPILGIFYVGATYAVFHPALKLGKI